MSDISTTKQVVDMERFGPHHDETFHGKREKRPGKTHYVWREGQLMVREDGWSMPVIPANPYGSYTEQVDRLQREAMRPYELATVSDLP